MTQKHLRMFLVIQVLDFHMKTLRTHTYQMRLISIRHDESWLK